MTSGYICCFTNPSMPNIIKIATTDEIPDILLNNSTTSDDWRPPLPYKLEFAKQCTNPQQKEKTLRMIITQYTPKLCSHRGFYNLSVDEIRLFFDLIDGQDWS
jgi:hypothetical protein